MTIDRHTVIMTLKEYLKSQGITIYQLAKAALVPRTTLEDIVNGKINLCDSKYSTLKKLSSFLEISVEDLVEEGGKVFYPDEIKTKKPIGKRNQTGRTGVCYRASIGKYRAYIMLFGKNIDLGSFGSLEEAIAARMAGERIKEILSEINVD